MTKVSAVGTKGTEKVGLLHPNIHILSSERPIPLKRHRSTRSGHMYDPSSKDKSNYIKSIKKQLPTKPLSGPLRVNIHFVFKSNIYKKDGSFRKGKDDSHVCKPDLSNLIKFYEDALTGYLWNDDCQIVEIQSFKIRGKKDSVFICVEEDV